MNDKSTVRVTFVNADGKRIEATGKPGESLLEVAHRFDVPIEGACEGCMACSTCHVIVQDPWYDRLPEPREEEEDMLDLAYDLQETSRLGCQVLLTEELDGMVLRLPRGSHNVLLG